MNHSIYSADRSTHLKIVVVALVAGIAVAAFGISVRSTSDDFTQTARVIKESQRQLWVIFLSRRRQFDQILHAI